MSVATFSPKSTTTSLPSTAKAVACTALRKAELVDWPVDGSPLKDNEVAGRTLVTLISPGTEINYNYDQPHDKPVVGGYAAVFEVDAVGAGVTNLRVGDRAFSMGNHLSRQRTLAQDAIPVPAGLSPERAVFARLMGVSWSTLTTTLARPNARVVILGLGPVGNLAAQMFQTAGYRVTAAEPSESRRKVARNCGVDDVRPTAIGQPDLDGQVALAIDCSGHEGAVLDACKVVRKGGEVVLVGVPWKRRTDASAFDVLHAVFHRYVVLRSGWEWELPVQPRDFAAGSIVGNLTSALQWIADGRVKVDALPRVMSPADAQQAYDDLLHQRGEHLSAVFDWQRG